MSSIARWSYQNVATVRPFVSQDLLTGQTLYGDEFPIACTWTAESKPERDAGGQAGARGAEFISQHVIFTEDKRPKYLDLITFDGSNGWEEIRSKTTWDMSSMGEPDSPDFKLVT